MRTLTAGEKSACDTYGEYKERILNQSIGSHTGNYWAEGPAPLFIGDTLYVYFDKYRDHRYGAVRSLDHGETWEDVSDQVSFPKGIRHGTAFAVDASVILDMIQ